MSLITCHNVSFSYEGQVVLNEINFRVEKGMYLCILGENGAGKSTLIKGLLHLKKPSSGSIVTGDGLKSNEIGYMPQQTQVQKDFPASVYEVVLSGRLNHLHLRPFYSKEDRRIAENRIEQLGIKQLSHHCYRELSGGQQQRVLLARALCATEKIILLDEPVTGLDPLMTTELYRVIRELNHREHITVLMVSHDVRDAVNDATHILQLGKKQLFFGTVEEYRTTSLGKQFLLGRYSA